MVTPEQAKDWLDLFVEDLSLQTWDISCVWVDAKTIPRPGGDPGTDYVGTIDADPIRWSAVLTVALDRELDDVAKTILHECLHLLLAEWPGTLEVARSYVPAALYNVLGDQRCNAEERAVELLERAIWKVGRYDNGR